MTATAWIQQEPVMPSDCRHSWTESYALGHPLVWIVSVQEWTGEVWTDDRGTFDLLVEALAFAEERTERIWILFTRGGSFHLGPVAIRDDPPLPSHWIEDSRACVRVVDCRAATS